MRRWRQLAGIGTSLLVATSAVSTSALALFYPQAKLEQFSLQTTHLSLLVSPDPQGASGSFVRSTPFTLQHSLRATNEAYATPFWIKNASTQGVRFRLFTRLNPGGQDWDALRHHIQVQIQSIAPFAETNWRSLAEWEGSTIEMPGGLLPGGEARLIHFRYRLPATYNFDPDGAGPRQVGDPIGEELVGKSTSGIELVIEGREE